MSSKKSTILFVDDEQSILASLERLFFDSDDLSILTAISGEQGLKTLESHTVDLIVADQRMPGMSGSKFLQIAKEKYPDTLRFMLTGYADIDSVVDAINKGEVYRFLTKPWNDDDLKITIYKALEYLGLKKENVQMSEQIQKQNKELLDLNTKLEERVAQRTEQLEIVVTRLKKIGGALKQNFSEIIYLLSGILSHYHKYLGEHSKRVAELSNSITETLGYSKEEQEQIYYGALLHDLGFIGAANTLFEKNKDDYDENEKKVFLQHPVVGQELISTVSNLKKIESIIRFHHEDFNGSGFPEGLRGVKIPAGARIVRIANDYDNLIFKGEKTSVQALEFIEKNAGLLYDGQIAGIFCNLISRNQNIGRKKTNRIAVRDLKPGMYLGDEIALENGLLLVPRGVLLNESLIKKINSLSSLINMDKELNVTL